MSTQANTDMQIDHEALFAPMLSQAEKAQTLMKLLREGLQALQKHANVRIEDNATCDGDGGVPKLVTNLRTYSGYNYEVTRSGRFHYTSLTLCLKSDGSIAAIYDLNGVGRNSITIRQQEGLGDIKAAAELILEGFCKSVVYNGLIKNPTTNKPETPKSWVAKRFCRKAKNG